MEGFLLRFVLYGCFRIQAICFDHYELADRFLFPFQDTRFLRLRFLFCIIASFSLLLFAGIDRFLFHAVNLIQSKDSFIRNEQQSVSFIITQIVKNVVLLVRKSISGPIESDFVNMPFNRSLLPFLTFCFLVK